MCVRLLFHYHHTFTKISFIIQQIKTLNSQSSNLLVRSISDKPHDPVTIIETVAVQKSVSKEIPAKTIPVQKMTLIHPNNTLTVTTLKDATNIAENSLLRLVKLIDLDVRSKRPIYKLMTEAQYLEEELAEKKRAKLSKKKDPTKGEKILLLSSRIEESDLLQKISRINRWIKRGYEIHITITGLNKQYDEQEKVFEQLEKLFIDKAKFLQKRYKGCDIRFQMVLDKSTKNNSLNEINEMNKETDNETKKDSN